MRTRMTLMHWLCSPATKVDKTTPYKGNESTKLNALLVIIVYHQSKRGAGPLKNDPNPPDHDLNRLIPDPDAKPPEGTKAIPDPDMPVDKIVVFFQFTETLWIVRNMLNENNIKFLEYNGTLSSTVRAKRLEEFRTSKDANVLLCTKVGTTGLNIPFARVGVVVVSCMLHASLHLLTLLLGSILVCA